MATENLGLKTDFLGAGPELHRDLAENFKKIDAASAGGGGGGGDGMVTTAEFEAYKADILVNLQMLASTLDEKVAQMFFDDLVARVVALETAP